MIQQLIGRNPWPIESLPRDETFLSDSTGHVIGFHPLYFPCCLTYSSALGPWSRTKDARKIQIPPHYQVKKILIEKGDNIIYIPDLPNNVKLDNPSIDFRFTLIILFPLVKERDRKDVVG